MKKNEDAKELIENCKNDTVRSYSYTITCSGFIKLPKTR